MVLETSILSQRGAGEQKTEAIVPEIKAAEINDTYGKFLIEPLERGYGITIGNPIRRMLLSSIEGTAITWVKIDGILHEYSSVPHMREEVMDFLLNVKGVRIRSVTGRPGKMRLEITGEGRICAGDVATSADFEIVNPEHHLATLDSDEASLSVEFNVDNGKGYEPVPQGDGTSSSLMGALPVDAIFSPVRKVNYTVERTRVGYVTDYERLVLEIWTDGTVTPVEAIKASSQVLVNHFFLFNSLGTDLKPGGDRTNLSVSPEVYQTPIEKLELSRRTLNCLKRAHITKVGQVLEMSNDELLKIRNLGEKSLQELLGKLTAEGMIGEDERPFPANGREEQVQETVAVVEAEDAPAGDEAPEPALDIVKDEEGGVPQAAEEVSQAGEEVPQAGEEVPQAEGEVSQAAEEVPQAEGEVPQAEGEVPQAEGEVKLPDNDEGQQ